MRAQLEPFTAEDAEVAEEHIGSAVLRELCGEKLLGAKTLGTNRAYTWSKICNRN